MSESLSNPYGDDDVKPNVIWFMVDQMRMQAMSIAGDPNLHTPNLDRLARDGTWFRQACMGFPLCCPARGSIMTGRYPHRAVPGHEYRLDPALPTLADPFNAAGYHTAWLGKWHLDGWHERNGRGGWHVVPPERRGRFKTWIGYENNNAQWDCWVHGHDGEREIDRYRLPGHESDALTDLLIEQMHSHHNKPFFACASLQPPHNPYSAPAEWTRRHNPATLTLRPNVPRGGRVEAEIRPELAGYYALIEHIDHNVGRVLDELERLGIHDRTFVVFVSDHGDQHGSHGHRMKMTPFEESIRVPCMIWGGTRWHYRGAGSCDHVINHVDLLPTTLGLCGLDAPDGVDGYDYSPVVVRGRHHRGSTDADAPQEAYLQSVVPTEHAPSFDQPWRGIATRDGWKYIAFEGQPGFLFDLDEDPYELRNLAHHAHARGKRHELNERLRGWIERTGDIFTLPDFTDQGRPAGNDAVRARFADHWVD